MCINPVAVLRFFRAVLIVGASGAGKTTLAKELADCVAPNAPFVEVDCAALEGDTLRAELFGYVRGAFTGANADGRTGLLEQANGGVLFLDEVGNLDMRGQRLILKAIEGVFTPVGASSPRLSRFIVIAATNEDLAARVEAGTFREDLYFRIARETVEVKSLSTRPEDVARIAQERCAELVDLGAAPEGSRFSAGALAALCRRDFTRGEARAVQNAVSRALLLCYDERDADDFGPLVVAERHVSAPARASRSKADIVLATLADVEGGLTRAELVDLSGLGDREAGHALQDLRRRGLVTIGQGKRWQVCAR